MDTTGAAGSTRTRNSGSLPPASRRITSARGLPWTRHLRILIAHSFYRLGGGEDRYVRQQVDLLGTAHEVKLIGTSNEDLTAGLKTAGKMLYSRRRGEIDDIMEEHRPDVVHVHNVYPGLGPAVHLAASRRSIPLVMTVHNFRLRCPNGYMYTEGSVCRRCEGGVYLHGLVHRCFPSKKQASAYVSALWIHRFLLKLEDKVSIFIAPSDFMGRQLQKWEIPPSRVAMVRNFTRLDPAASSDPGVYGIYVGRLSSEKGLHFLLAALNAAGDPPFKIVGDGPLRGDLVAEAARLGLQRTEFVGPVPAEEINGFMSRARFLVMPSESHENSPLAALEALACGRPLVVSDMGGLPELVKSGAGVMFASGNVEEAATNIRSLMDNDDLARELGSAALEFAQKELTSQTHLDGLENVYARAASVTSS